MDYQSIAKKISDFIIFKAQIMQLRDKLESLESNPPKIEQEVLTWEEAVQFAETQKQHEENVKRLRMGIGNRLEIIESRENEIAKLLPIQNHFILFDVMIEDKKESYKIGFFPESGGFRMEKIED